MNIFCPEPCVTCAPIPLGAEGIFPNPNSEANPFSNFSSEAPDLNLFIGTKYRNITDDPLVGGLPFRSTGCVSACISYVSQEDADLCAARQQIICLSDDNPQTPCQINPGLCVADDFCLLNPNDALCRPVSRPVFFNQSQFCTITCPDGAPYVFTVAAGIFNEFNQATANAVAYSFACQQAGTLFLCWGELSQSQACLGVGFSSSVSVISLNSRAVTFAITNGSLPPGLSPAQTAPNVQAFIGTPSSLGTYTFTLSATDAAGKVISKTFTIIVVDIATAAPVLPGATTGSAYSTTMTASGPVGIPVWTITGGSLPPGLTLSSATGVISGTPTTAGTYLFNVTMTPA